MKRYAIWNKRDPILTPIGEVLTAEEWIDRYPIAGIGSVTVVCGAGGDQRRIFRHSGPDGADVRGTGGGFLRL